MSAMMKTDAVRQGFRERLPVLMCAVLKSYDAFTGGEVPLDAKAFAAHHAAAKAALSHFETLCKLEQWGDKAMPSAASGDPAVADLIGEARAALALVTEGGA